MDLRAMLAQHHADSYGWALACCRRDAEAAENALQSAYLEVLEGRAKFDGRASFKTWLFAVIRNHARRETRWRFWHWQRSAELEPELAARGPAVDEQAEASQMQARLRQALGELPQRQREVLQLVFYHELSVAEAAAVLGIAVGSARQHYERGKKRLRERLQEVTAHGRREALPTVPGRETRG